MLQWLITLLEIALEECTEPEPPCSICDGTGYAPLNEPRGGHETCECMYE